MNRLIGLAIVSSLALAPAAAVAQQKRVALRACVNDVKQFCASSPANKMRDCIKSNFKSFSQTCQNAVTTRVELVKSCKNDVKKNCAGVLPGGGRLKSCIKANFVRFSRPCQSAMVRARLGSLKARFNPQR
jgi:hypothetical protein